MNYFDKIIKEEKHRITISILNQIKDYEERIKKLKKTFTDTVFELSKELKI